MGCNLSVFPSDSTATVIAGPKWKTYLSSEDAKDKYTLDGTLPPDSGSSILELRIFLDDPDLIGVLVAYAKPLRLEWKSALACWNDIIDFKAIEEECVDYQATRAQAIYQEHIQTEGSYGNEKVGNIKGDVLAEIKESLTSCVTSTIFDKIFFHILVDIHERIFLPFKKTDAYSSVVEEVKKSYSTAPEDFDYMAKLGQGGFGLVIHARKKSTSVHYAVKVQSKVGLLNCFRRNMERVVDEKNSLVLCSHPFIIGLDYAFQTPTLAIMVMELGTAGTLWDQLNECFNYKMTHERVVFYAAEIVLALIHIHNLGFIYRDLKLGNVILCADGHIKLVDLGGIIDAKGKLLSKFGGQAQKPTNLFATTRQQIHVPESTKRLGTDPSTNRNNLSVMGTDGYMAPEMRRDGDGYTKAIDYWTLGVMLFEMLHGRKPFQQEVSLDDGFFIDSAHGPSTSENPDIDKNPQLNSRAVSVGSNFLGGFVNAIAAKTNSDFLIYFKTEDGTIVPPTTMDLLGRFLMVDARRRLGAGSQGAKNIKGHAFFNTIDWDKLADRSVDPPFLPKVVKPLDTPLYDSFTHMTAELCKESIWSQAPTRSQERFFDKWNYVSPRAVHKEVYMMQLV